MTELSERRSGANADHPSTDPAAALPALCWDNAAQVAAFFDHLRDHAAEVIAVGEDATRRVRRRVRSRPEARRCIQHTGETLLELIAFAERGLPGHLPSR
jgi:hypothetical protein